MDRDAEDDEDDSPSSGESEHSPDSDFELSGPDGSCSSGDESDDVCEIIELPELKCSRKKKNKQKDTGEWQIFSKNPNGSHYHELKEPEPYRVPECEGFDGVEI